LAPTQSADKVTDGRYFCKFKNLYFYSGLRNRTEIWQDDTQLKLWNPIASSKFNNISTGKNGHKPLVIKQ